MRDLISRKDAIALVDRPVVPTGDADYDNAREWERESIKDDLLSLPSAEPKTGWIPVSERLPEHSYTKRFWLTVKLDDDKGTVATLIGTWGAWGGKGNKPYDAFDCWKDVMINGGIYRMSQPIPKEQVLAWMPLPEPYREDGGE